MRHVTPILNVSNIVESFEWFERLGWRRGFSWPHGDANPVFGSVCSDKAEIFLCRGAQGSRGTIMPKTPGDDSTDGVWMIWWVETPAEVDALHQSALSHRMTVASPPADKPRDLRELHLWRPDGHMFPVGASLYEPHD